MTNLSWGSNYAFWIGSVKHAVILLVVAAMAWAIVVVGRRLSAAGRRAVERVAGLMVVGAWLAGFFFDLANPRASASTTLPLHWCDVCGVLAIFVMYRPQYRLPRTLLHFWALCLCTFAFALPAIGLGPAFIDFWIYFGTHTAIILTAVYDAGVRRYTPGPRDVGVAFACAAGWTLLLQPVNLALGSNYGFVGADDSHVRRAIVALGAWPWRLAPMLAIALAMMSALMLLERAIAAARFTTRRPPMPMPIPFPATPQRRPLADAA